ncbi:MAG TPA: YebC/PmpR family DNA-binding transcriptional regulator [Thermoanaerobaculia bacterium]|nr:YebC/PmpR family DNA-binding transcriptional regulator [Thermoanaerobaculia bacterium]
MSGHSKWSTIKHKKGAADAKRGRIFTRLIKELTVAAREGGGSVDTNARLRKAVDDAKAANMPADNIKRAIQRGTGELPGVQYEEVVFEGYGPGGAAIFIEALTDNKNRTLPEIRHMFTKNGGNLGESGCVRFMFDKKGYIAVERDKVAEDRLMELALEAGADDLATDDPEYFEIYTSPESLAEVKQALEAKGVAVAAAEVSMIPQTPVKLDDAKSAQLMKLMEAIEEHDDVQNVWTAAELPESA